jgi:lipoic acid synthetase
VADAAATMGLDYVVITSVTRDDLPDGGASWFARTIHEIRKRCPSILVEVLIPDFMGSRASIQTVVKAYPDVLNHNIETVPRLYDTVRPVADYHRSLALLRHVRRMAECMPVKSGLMLGLGEKDDELLRTFADLLDAGCTILTLGQYLQPSRNHLPVQRFIPPEEFEKWQRIALKMGFRKVASGPFVRSSYHAKSLYEGCLAEGKTRNRSRVQG